MIRIAPFRGLRYNVRKVGSLSRVVTPPYDVISPAGQRRYHRRHPCNFIRVILGLEKPEDGARSNRYIRAKQTLEGWLRKGILRPDALPSIYPYRQDYVLDGLAHRRWGLIALVHLGESHVYPHEETRKEPLKDRLRLLEAARASLSPIFGLVPDAGGSYRRLILRLSRGRPVGTARLDGVRHRLWRTADPRRIRAASRFLASRDLVIADGHHRYEAARRFRERQARRTRRDPRAPHQFAMFYLAAVGEEEPGLLPHPRNGREAVPGIRKGRLGPPALTQRPRIGEVLRRALRNRLMPGKTTYFYPKPLAGLVEYKFELP